MATLVQDIQSYWNGGILKRLVMLLCIAYMVFSISIILFRGFARVASDHAVDFFQFYSAGQLWNEGKNPYDYPTFIKRQLINFDNKTEKMLIFGYLYPPFTTFVASLIAPLPLNTAYLIEIILNFVFLIVVLGLLLLVMHWYRPIGLLELTLIIAFLNTTGIRDTIRSLQVGIILFVCVMGAFVIRHYKREALAGIILSLVSLKPTFLILYTLYYLIRRRINLFASLIITGILINALPVLLTGRSIIEQFSGWINILQLYGTADLNIPDPFSYNSISMLHLQSLVNRFFNGEGLASTVVTWILIIGLCSYTFYLIWRAKLSLENELLDFALISALSLIIVYHRSYDNVLMLPGIMVIFIYIFRQKNSVQKYWMVLLLILLAILSIPGDIIASLSYQNASLLSGSYLYRLLLGLPAMGSLLMVISLLWIKQREIKLQVPVTDSASFSTTSSI